jgi:hypothetical protein
MAEPSGVEPSALMPTFWAKADAEISRAAIRVLRVFIFAIYFESFQ